jgi:tetratricopeptide (TPR) repeat protein
MKPNATSKPFFSPEFVAAAIAAAPERVEDADCPYDPNDAAAVDAFWDKAIVSHSYPELKAKLAERRARKAEKAATESRAGQYETATAHLEQAVKCIRQRIEENTRSDRLDLINTQMLLVENAIKEINSPATGVARGGELWGIVQGICESIDREFSGDDNLEIQGRVAGALFNKGVALSKQGKTGEEMAVYEEVERRFGNKKDASPGVRVLVAKALLQKGIMFGRRNETKRKAIAVYEEVERRFGKNDSRSVLVLVAIALFNKGLAWGELGETERAIAVYDEVVHRFGDKMDVLPGGVRLVVAEALFNKGIALRRQGKTGEAIAVYEEIERRFGEDDLPDVRVTVAMAREQLAWLKKELPTQP